jgi:hypothetical protein
MTDLVSVRLPASLHARLSALAEREGISLDRLIASAAAEKADALMSADYLAERASRGSRSRYEAALSAVPDAEPDAHDRP